jgi:hypothetical protein
MFRGIEMNETDRALHAARADLRAGRIERRQFLHLALGLGLSASAAANLAAMD